MLHTSHLLRQLHDGYVFHNYVVLATSVTFVRKNRKIDLLSKMAPAAENEGYSLNGAIGASTTVVVVGAGPAGLMLACVKIYMLVMICLLIISLQM